jgi:hypothetical protein
MRSLEIEITPSTEPLAIIGNTNALRSPASRQNGVAARGSLEASSTQSAFALCHVLPMKPWPRWKVTSRERAMKRSKASPGTLQPAS